MTQQYHIAFSIFFKHQFFSDGDLKSFVVTPTAKTALKLRNMGAMIKTFQQGFHVLYDTLAHGNNRSRSGFFENGEVLKFIVMNNDTNFFNYTADCSSDISGNYFFFSNSKSDSSPSADVKESLQIGAFVGKGDLRPVDTKDPDLFVKPFGMIAIKLHKNLEETFVISFASAATYWCYVITTAYLQELAHPAIVRKETKEVFKGPIPIQLTANTTASAFFSTAAVLQKERPAGTCQLVEDYNTDNQSYKVVLPALPGPDRRHLSSLKTTEEYKEKDVSYIFI